MLKALGNKRKEKCASPFKRDDLLQGLLKRTCRAKADNQRSCAHSASPLSFSPGYCGGRLTLDPTNASFGDSLPLPFACKQAPSTPVSQHNAGGSQKAKTEKKKANLFEYTRRVGKESASAERSQGTRVSCGALSVQTSLCVLTAFNLRAFCFLPPLFSLFKKGGFCQPFFFSAKEGQKGEAKPPHFIKSSKQRKGNTEHVNADTFLSLPFSLSVDLSLE